MSAAMRRCEFVFSRLFSPFIFRQAYADYAIASQRQSPLMPHIFISCHAAATADSHHFRYAVFLALTAYFDIILYAPRQHLIFSHFSFMIYFAPWFAFGFLSPPLFEAIRLFSAPLLTDEMPLLP
jgi:hypothetical protein